MEKLKKVDTFRAKSGNTMVKKEQEKGGRSLCHPEGGTQPGPSNQSQMLSIIRYLTYLHCSINLGICETAIALTNEYA